MPTTLADPVLSLAVNNIHKIDSINVECLSSMWTVFTKCKENLENGRRLENLSWRLWFRESLPFDPALPVDILRPNLHPPGLSSSVDSEDSDDDIRCVSNAPAVRPPAPKRTYSSRSRHLTPDDFQRLISSLAPHSTDGDRGKEFRLDRPAVFSAPAEKTICVDTSTKSSTAVDLHPSSSCPHDPPQRPSSTNAVRPNGSVVHGFQVSTSTAATLKTDTTPISSVKHGVAFYLPASVSPSPESPPNNSPTPRASSRLLLKPSLEPLAVDTKDTFAPTEENDDEWDSIYTSSSASSPTETPLFPKVESRPPLNSNRSLLSCLLESKSCVSKSTPSLSRLAPAELSPRPARVPAILKTAPLRSLVRKPSTCSVTASASRDTALQISASPRTTRRNMLATELSESLRRNLLWERQQKTMTSAAVLKRRHTSHDISTLSEFPNPTRLSPGDTFDGAGFDQAAHHEYHAVGW